MASRYDTYSYAQYTPLSAQEILMPSTIMRERHDVAEAQQAELQNKAAAINYIAQASDDPEIKSIADTFNQSMTNAANTLSSEGFKSSTMRDMYGLRNEYTNKMAPMEAAYTLTQQRIAERQKRQAQDPSLRFKDNLPS